GPIYQITNYAAVNTTYGNNYIPQFIDFQQVTSGTIGANDDRLSAATAADWKFLHDGTGATVFFIAQPGTEVNNCFFSTGGFSTHTGLTFFLDDSGSSEGR